VFFIGDNGTAPDAVSSPRDPEQAKHTIYEGGTNVPFVVSGPGVARGESAALVHVVDVLPTVAALAGVDVARAGKVLDGTSFAAALADPASPSGRRFVYTERLGAAGPPPHKLDWRAVRDDRYKLVDVGDGLKLYDLQGRFDDGPEQDQGKLDAAGKRHYEALKTELERLRREVRFEY
jgi:arylsulfatase A-like enzyme